VAKTDLFGGKNVEDWLDAAEYNMAEDDMKEEQDLLDSLNDVPSGKKPPLARNYTSGN